MKSSRISVLATALAALFSSALWSALCVAAEALPRTVSVTGKGEVQAEPDLAMVTLGVESRQSELGAARDEVTAVVEQVLALTGELDIDSEHVHATRVHVQPEYDWNNDGRERRLIGYYVSRQVEVELRNLDRLGRLLERAFDLGVNQVGAPQLDSSRRRALERQALAKAVEDARLNAEAVARAAGAGIGAVRTISAESSVGAPPRPLPMRAMAEAADDAAETYQTGQMKFTATVQARYDLVAD